MAVEFYKKNIVTTINPKDISNDYRVEECINLTRDINIIYGMPQTGKTSLAKYFKENFGFELLDFKELTEKIKKTKVILDFQNFLNIMIYIQKYFQIIQYFMKENIYIKIFKENKE